MAVRESAAWSLLRRSAPALLVFGLLPFLCAPGLLWGEWIWYRDAWQSLAPLKMRAGAALARGELPLWSADAGGGVPLLGNPSPGSAYPLNVLLAWMPVGWGLSMLSAVHLSIAGLATRALARALGAGAAGAWIAGVAFAVSGPVVSHLPTLSHGVACAWIPVALLGTVHLARAGRWDWGGVAAGALAMCVIGGEAQLALYAAAAMAFTAWFVAPAGTRSVAIGRVMAIAPLAACLAAVQVLPTLEWLGQIGVPVDGGLPGEVMAGRAQPWELAARGSWRPDVLVTESLVPGALGWPTGRFWGGQHGTGFRYVTSASMGAMVLMLAVLGWRARSARPAAAWTVAGLWLSLGKYAGLYWLCYQLVPGFSSFRYADKALPFAALGVAVAAGFGWRTWTDPAMPEVDRRRRERWLWGGASVWVLVAIITAVAGPLWSIPAAVDDVVLCNAAPWRWPAAQSALLVSGAVALITLAGRGALGRAALPIGVAWVALAGAWVHAPAAPTGPVDDFFGPSDVSELLGDASPLRWRLVRIAGPRPNAGLLEDAARWERRARRNYLAYGALLEDRATIDSFETSLLRGYVSMIQSTHEFRWLGALGVRDVVSVAPLDETAGLELIGRTDAASCYRNPHALPRVRLVGAVERVADDVAMRARLMAADFPQATRVCVREADAALHAAALASLEPAAAAAGRAALESDDGRRLVIQTEAPGPTLCVVADLLYPGWTAQVDGVTVPILAANGYFRGVVVPAGRHTVTMEMSSSRATLGAWLSVLGVLVMAGLAWRERRSRLAGDVAQGIA